MRKFPGKSIISIHKELAKKQFNELKYEGVDKDIMRKTFIQQYFLKSTIFPKKDK